MSTFATTGRHTPVARRIRSVWHLPPGSRFPPDPARPQCASPFSRVGHKTTPPGDTRSSPVRTTAHNGLPSATSVRISQLRHSPRLPHDRPARPPFGHIHSGLPLPAAEALLFLINASYSDFLRNLTLLGAPHSLRSVTSNQPDCSSSKRIG